MDFKDPYTTNVWFELDEKLIYSNEDIQDVELGLRFSYSDGTYKPPLSCLELSKVDDSNFKLKLLFDMGDVFPLDHYWPFGIEATFSE